MSSTADLEFRNFPPTVDTANRSTESPDHHHHHQPTLTSVREFPGDEDRTAKSSANDDEKPNVPDESSSDAVDAETENESGTVLPLLGIKIDGDQEFPEECCHTPRSKEHQIPPPGDSPPPAPRKRRSEAISSPPCKRKLFDCFEANNREEVEEFFRSGFEFVAKQSKRKIRV